MGWQYLWLDVLRSDLFDVASKDGSQSPKMGGDDAQMVARDHFDFQFIDKVSPYGDRIFGEKVFHARGNELYLARVKSRPIICIGSIIGFMDHTRRTPPMPKLVHEIGGHTLEWYSAHGMEVFPHSFGNQARPLIR